MAQIFQSEQVLTIKKKFDEDLLDYSGVEDFVKELTKGREYQEKAIFDILRYLWGGEYENILDLAKENYKKKTAIKQRFSSEELFLNNLPLPHLLSGVCHMATGTGKSFVMFAVAYLSIILGKVDRVLVIGPASKVIEKGLNEKFREYLYGETGMRLQNFLPERYRNRRINLLNANDPIEDQSIIIENVNAIWNNESNSIGDTLFNPPNTRVLILSDEVHHAYSHLKFNEKKKVLEETDKGDKEERLWMHFLKSKPIKYHIGFTGTPYNGNEFFTDIIYNYSIKEGVEAKYIKKINPVIEDKGEILETANKYQIIIQNQLENIQKYSYPDEQGRRTVKPITIFISKAQTVAKSNKEEFIKALAKYYKNEMPDYKSYSDSELEIMASQKVILVVSDENPKEYQEQLNKIEEIDENKVGGKVEYIFSVNKLSEGWDVDNVFQIVPSEQRAFKSKLLISQILGRGLRMPRKVPLTKYQFTNYPTVKVTNHERFSDEIQKLLDEVLESELRLSSSIVKEKHKRYEYNFKLININYLPKDTIEKIEQDERQEKLELSELVLKPQSEIENVNVVFLYGQNNSFTIRNDFTTLDFIVNDILRKFRNINFENTKFFKADRKDFPGLEEIKTEIKNAMENAGISGNKISLENKKIIELHFNKLISKGTKKITRESIKGNLFGLITNNLPSSSINIGKLEEDGYEIITNNFVEDIPEDFATLEKELISKNMEQETLFGARAEASIIKKISVKGNLFSIDSEKFKTPQNCIIISHKPEFYFVTRLLENNEMYDSFIKSSDMGFYSIDYTYWKNQKDRKTGSFNPDFFFKVSLEKYSKLITNEMAKAKLRELENKGFEEIIFSVELKSESDDSEMTKQKEKAAIEHFKNLNEEIEKNFNLANFGSDFVNDYKKQYYVFKLLRHSDQNREVDDFFRNLKTGTNLF